MTELKNIASVGFGEVAGSLITIGFWFYLANVLEVENFGQIHFYLGIAGVVYVFSLIGTPYSITVYSAKKINLESTLIFLSLIIGSIASLIVFVIYQRIDISLIIMGFIIFESSSAYLLGKKLYINNTKYLVTQKSLSVLLALVFFYLFGLEGIILGFSLSFLHYILIIIKIFKTQKINFKILKEKQKFILNNYFMNIVGGIRSQIDKIIIGPLIGFEILGNYALVLMAYSGLMIFSNSMFKYILPHQSTETVNKKIPYLSVLISVGIAILGTIMGPILIEAFFPKYIQAIISIQIISWAIIPSTISLIVSSKFLGKEKSSQIFISRIIMLATLIIGILILGSLFNTPGAATAFLISHILQMVSLLILYKVKKLT